jgi:hypothetical protein
MSERSIPKRLAKGGNRYDIFFGKLITEKESDMPENRIMSDCKKENVTSSMQQNERRREREWSTEGTLKRSL